MAPQPRSLSRPALRRLRQRIEARDAADRRALDVELFHLVSDQPVRLTGEHESSVCRRCGLRLRGAHWVIEGGAPGCGGQAGRAVVPFYLTCAEDAFAWTCQTGLSDQALRLELLDVDSPLWEAQLSRPGEPPACGRSAEMGEALILAALTALIRTEAEVMAE
ncbi:hypothetical protein ACO2Q3_20940 [Caulobacter sp. KR2-114]|uniref:hypothetical protein n=1 Tax=Caulobacter sp. KR2-114 TaxID=3400912 RepID=UPI003C04387E